MAQRKTMSKKYYLDANFASQTSREVWEKATDFQLQYRSGLHAPYQILSCQEKLKLAREQIARAIGTEPRDYIYATSSHCQNATAIFHAIYKNFIYPTGKNIVLISAFDSQTEKALEPFVGLGCVIKKVVPNAKGQITVREIEKAISPKTAFISLPFADPLTGIVYPIWDIGEYCRQMGIFFHVESSHILGQMIFPFSSLPADFLSFDGRHICGLSGIAICCAKREISISGIWEEENRWDAPSLLVALGFALSTISSAQEYTCLEIARYKSILEKKLIDAMPAVQILFPRVEQLSNTSVIAFPGIHSEALLYALHDKEVYASIGNPNGQSLARILSTCPEYACLADQSIHCSFTLDINEEDLVEITHRIVHAAKSLHTVSGIL